MSDLLEKLERLRREASNYAKIGDTAPWRTEFRLKTLRRGHLWLSQELTILIDEVKDAGNDEPEG